MDSAYIIALITKKVHERALVTIFYCGLSYKDHWNF